MFLYFVYFSTVFFIWLVREMQINTVMMEKNEKKKTSTPQKSTDKNTNVEPCLGSVRVTQSGDDSKKCCRDESEME